MTAATVPTSRPAPRRWRSALVGLAVALLTGGAQAQGAAPGTYGLKVYRVDSSLYPYVQVYFRTFNE